MNTISINPGLRLHNLLAFSTSTLTLVAFLIFNFQFSTLSAQNPIFYGFTNQGGADGYGNIFKYAAGPGTFDDAVDFTGITGSAPGNGPSLGHMTLATDGNLYGVTGGNSNLGSLGTIFKYNPTTSVFTNLINFTGDTGTANVGSGPYDIMQASDGNFYGVTVWGGYGQGEIFKYNPNTNAVTDLYNFTGGDSGSTPESGLIQATDGNLYGTAWSGAFEGAGSLFKFNIITNTFTLLVDFTRTSGPYLGANPQGGTLLQSSDGNIYGSTESGGLNNYGTLFQYNPNTDVFTSLLSFTGSTGSYLGGYPACGLIQATNGNLYGMTSYGGTNGNGNVFEFNYNTGAFTSIVNFTGPTGAYIGGQPVGALLQASDGNLYGMTTEENYYPTDYGTIFEYNLTNGNFTNVVNFTGATGPFVGSLPQGDLMEDTHNSLTVSAAAMANVSCFGGTNGNAFATVSGDASSFTYSWSKGGTSVISTSNPTGPILSAGTYTLTVTDNMDTFTQTALVTITQPAALSLTTSVSNNSCGGGSNGKASVNITGGVSPYNYTWINGSSSIVSTSNPTGAILSGGSYTVSVLDNCGSSQTAGVTISESPIINLTLSTQTNIKCNGSSTGSLTSHAATGGVSPFTYSWTPSGGTALTASDLSAGIYTLTATDSHGCSASISANITQPAMLRDSLVNGSMVGPSCYGGDNGTATIGVIGGTPPYTFTWSPAAGSNANAITLKGQNYTVTVKDKNGCSETLVISVTQPLAIRDSIVAVSKQNITCNDANNGYAVMGAKFGTMPYTYLWSNGQTTNQAPNLSAGTYTVHITDANGCTGSTSTSITQPAMLRDSMIAADIENVKCNGGSTGYTTVGVKGGSSPYTYSWAPLSGSASKLTGMSAITTYSVFVTDKNGCSASSTIILTQPSVLTTGVSGVVIGPTCYGGDNGSASILATGGTTPYTYTWTSTVSTTSSAYVLKAQAYTVTVKDKNGCSETIGFTVTQPLAIRDSIIAVSKVNESCNGESTGSATAGAKFGTTPYTYNWQPNGGTNGTASNLSAGTYTVHISDSHGCTASASTSITQPLILRDSISTFSCSGSTVKATAGVKGGSSPYTYLWMPGSGTKSMMTGLSEGTYTIMVTDKHGCGATTSDLLSCTVDTRIGKGDEKNDPDCCPSIDNISLYPNPNTGQFTIQWSVVSGQWSVEIYNVLGEKVYSQLSIVNSQLLIDLSNRANGIYLVRIISKEGTLVSQKKVVKTQ